MSKIHRFEDIDAWQMARTLTDDVYKLTLEEGFGIARFVGKALCPSWLRERSFFLPLQLNLWVSSGSGSSPIV